MSFDLDAENRLIDFLQNEKSDNKPLRFYDAHSEQVDVTWLQAALKELCENLQRMDLSDSAYANKASKLLEAVHLLSKIYTPVAHKLEAQGLQGITTQQLLASEALRETLKKTALEIFQDAQVREYLLHIVAQYRQRAQANLRAKQEADANPLKGPIKHAHNKYSGAIDAAAGQALYDPLTRVGVVLAELVNIISSEQELVANPQANVLEAADGNVDEAQEAYRQHMHARFGGEQAMNAAPAAAAPPAAARGPGQV